MGDVAGSSGVILRVDECGGVTVVLDGVPQSYVRLDDPALLAFEYVQQFALVIDTLPAGALAVTHVGGGGLTLPRWVGVTRPGSPQIVLEPDVALTDAVRRELPLPRGHRIRVRPVDGATGVAALREASADVAVVDAYALGRMPAELAAPPFLNDVCRVVRSEGVLLLNVADEAARRHVARVVASVRASGFPTTAMVATVDVLRGRRFGNTVVVAGGASLDVDELQRGAARMPLPTGMRAGAALERFLAGAKPFTNDDVVASPEPPDPGRWRAV